MGAGTELVRLHRPVISEIQMEDAIYYLRIAGILLDVDLGICLRGTGLRNGNRVFWRFTNREDLREADARRCENRETRGQSEVKSIGDLAGLSLHRRIGEEVRRAS